MSVPTQTLTGHEQATPTAPTPRLARIPLQGGGSLSVPCPAWCVDAHDAPEHPVDVTHVSDQVALTLPVHGGAETVLRAMIQQSPYSDRFRSPTAVLWPSDEGEPQEGMLPDDLDAVISLLVDHVAALQGLRDRLAHAREVWSVERDA